MDLADEEGAGEEDLFIGEGGEDQPRDFAPTKDEVLFLVDGSQRMFGLNDLGETPLFLVLEAVVGFLKDKVIAAGSDNVGIVLYNLAETRNHMNVPGVYVYQELAPPDAQRIKELQTVVQRKNIKLTPARQESLLVEALWLCHDMFTRTKTTAAADRRIFLFTDEDQPNQRQPQDQRRAIQRAKDLAEQNITIELFPFNKPQGKFDFRLFYQEILAIDQDENADPIVGAERLEDLTSLMRKKQFKKRTQGKALFQVTPTMRIAVKYYVPFRRTSRPVPVKLNAKDNRRMKTVTKWICEESGKELWQHELGNYMEYGKEKVKVTKEDMGAIKTFDAPGLKLMGFKSKSRVKDYMNIRPAYFLYPDDEFIRGSAPAFHALLTSMLRKEKVAIASIIPRAGTIVRFVAMLPSLDPPGLYLVYMPYADDMRVPTSVIDERDPEAAGEREVTSAAALVRELHIKEVDLGVYPNPSLQHFYANLEALALEQGQAPETVDALDPDLDGFQQKSPFLKDFFSLVQGENRPGKRPAAGAAPRAAKRAKDEDCVKKEELFSEAELRKMTVAELKDVLKDKRLPTAGKKQELIDRILGS